MKTIIRKNNSTLVQTLQRWLLESYKMRWHWVSSRKPLLDSHSLRS
ncbi:MAG: hypothetical protein ACFB15_14095 [Cyclobacteriaceae bacterium]